MDGIGIDVELLFQMNAMGFTWSGKRLIPD